MTGPASKRLAVGLALAPFLAALQASAQAPKATLLVRTDLPCSWRLDGEDRGKLDLDARVRVEVGLGEHLIEAVAAEGGYKWRKTLKVSEAQATMVTIGLRAQANDAKQKAAREAEEADLRQHPTWTDPATGLMWARRDNGSDVDWQGARQYCSTLSASRYGSYSGWRMPEIGELEAIFDPSADGHIKGRIALTTLWVWSATAAETPGQAWCLVFLNDVEYSNRLDYSTNGRALCVRRSGE